MAVEFGCARVDDIWASLALDKPVARSIIEHAIVCADCLFALSCGLAALKAIHTTNRVYGKDCLEAEEIGEVLIKTIMPLKDFPKSFDKSLAQKFAIMNLPQDTAEYLAPKIRKISECEFCSDYYNELFDNTLKFQEDYEELILGGADIRPLLKDFSTTVDARKIRLFEQTRPN